MACLMIFTPQEGLQPKPLSSAFASRFQATDSWCQWCETWKRAVCLAPQWRELEEKGLSHVDLIFDSQAVGRCTNTPTQIFNTLLAISPWRFLHSEILVLGKSGTGSSIKMGSLGLHGGVREPKRDAKGPGYSLKGCNTWTWLQKHSKTCPSGITSIFFFGFSWVPHPPVTW